MIKLNNPIKYQEELDNIKTAVRKETYQEIARLIVYPSASSNFDLVIQQKFNELQYYLLAKLS